MTEVVLKDEASMEKTTELATRLGQLGQTRIINGAAHAQRQAADIALREAKEEQRLNLMTAKKAASVTTELLALRGTGGSAKSRRKFASKAMALVSDSQKMQASGLRFEDANQDDEGEESEDNEA
ncbi:unnamed protein product [Cladocopium goreaui]|uniref:Uncharacterized protein n=1 Tax=Cladocopium goreaui TaxID=2562237 RepID=A0A9P1G7S8_9DINO|nr:unnamed protein product [Cladocopium goreaui]